MKEHDAFIRTPNDIYDEEGNLLIAKGKKLNDNLIQLLAKRNIDIKKLANEENNKGAKEKNDNHLEKALNENVQEFLQKIEGIDNSFYKKVPRLVENIIENLRKNYFCNILLKLLYERTKWVYSHSINVSLLSSFIGYKMCLSENDIEKITMGSLLHDIGQILIPLEILNKPSVLTKNEYEIIKMHPSLGYDLIKETNLNESAILIAKQHHERCDGTGYPKGLLIDQIHIYSQIVMVADVFDALTTARPYREPLSQADSLEIIQRGKGNKFNIDVIDALFELFLFVYKAEHKI